MNPEPLSPRAIVALCLTLDSKTQLLQYMRNQIVVGTLRLYYDLTEKQINDYLTEDNNRATVNLRELSSNKGSV